MTYLIGCDLGTTATKTGLFDENGKLLAISRRDSHLIYGKDGSVIQDPYEMLHSVVETVREVMDKTDIDPSQVASVALDGQMAGIMGVAENGEPATPYDSWLDIRSAPYAQRMKDQGEELIIRRSGMGPSINHGPKILWWKNEHPDIYRSIAGFTIPSSWVVQKFAGLSGADTFMDYSNLIFSCFSDIKNMTWDKEIIARFEVDEDKFPRIVKPWEVIGQLEKQWADKMGLLPGTPLAAGCGDQAANVLGAGVVEEGMAFDVAGTASCFALNVKKFAPDVRHKTLLFPRSVLPDFYFPMAYINGGGMDLEWAKNELFREYASLPDAFSRITAEVEKTSTEPTRLVFLPHLRGRNCPTQPSMRGVLAGFSWDHKREHLFRAILEGIAYEYAYYLGVLRELIPDASFYEVRVVGGGAKSSFWNRIKASVLGIPYVELDRTECAIWGAALVAGHSAGVFSDLAGKSSATVNRVKTYPPDEELSKTYEQIIP
ncbi:MAG TPA: FGGY family carbohydrate kinase, partial [Atribacteraceae bacterium]|nr:FGGY family carbohydrate kinase [Atribacteraceae bacterium]